MVRIEDIEPVVVERRQCSDHPAHHRHRVGVAPEREVEAIEAFHRREPSLLDSALDHPPFALDQFEFGQAQKITRVVDPFGSALLGDLVVFTQERRQPERFQVMRAQERRQPERFQVMLEQELGRVAHDEAPARRPR